MRTHPGRIFGHQEHSRHLGNILSGPEKSQTSGFQAKVLVSGRAFGCRPKGLKSADGREIAVKAFGPEVRPEESAGCPARQAFVVTLSTGLG